MEKTFYVTTPIYYPNDVPHLGHAYTTIAADVLSRWHKIKGDKVFFLTGTDEHGKKIAETASKAGKSPKEFVDNLIPKFKEAWKDLNINYDYFIRTTDKSHEKIVQEVLKKCYENGDIYKGVYEGLYCTGCEAYYTERDCPDKTCPIHKKQLENLKEESYFFKLSKYKDKLLKLYKDNPEFISPENKKNEIINRIKEELRDFSISRTSFDWGIQLPFDKKHYCYVWFDALLNYYSATKLKGKEEFWPTDVHIVGKDIIWFHVVYWPAMLMSAKIKLPKKVFAHGWWTVHGAKMGKSAGNSIKIPELISYAGVDAARYFLLRETTFGEDGDFSEEALIERYNNELANKLGNLVLRVSTLAEKYGLKKTKEKIISKENKKKIISEIENLEFDKAIHSLMKLTDKINEYIQNKKPWETKDKSVLYTASNAIKDVTILFNPVIPETTEKISETFNFDISLKSLNADLKISKIAKSEVLFEKKELKAKESKEEKLEGVMNMNEIKYEDFTKIDLRVAQIKKVEDIEGADKIYKLTIDAGELGERTICAGLKQHYKKESLKGKKIIYLSNLAPRNMKGIESQGMLLAASNSNHEKVIIISPESDIENGSKIN